MFIVLRRFRSQHCLFEVKSRIARLIPRVEWLSCFQNMYYGYQTGTNDHLQNVHTRSLWVSAASPWEMANPSDVSFVSRSGNMTLGCSKTMFACSVSSPLKETDIFCTIPSGLKPGIARRYESLARAASEVMSCPGITPARSSNIAGSYKGLTVPKHNSESALLLRDNNQIHEAGLGSMNSLLLPRFVL